MRNTRRKSSLQRIFPPWSPAAGWGIQTAYTNQYAKLEADSNYPDEKLEEYGVGSLRKAAKDGNATEGCFLAGQIAGMVNKEQPAAEIIEEIMTKAEQMMEGVKWDV